MCLFEENQSNTISVTLQVQEEQPTKCLGNLLNFFLQTKICLKNVTFDCIPYDLLLAKIACGINDNSILDIYSYLLKYKQCVCINNMPSQFNIIISGVAQGSIEGTSLFNNFFNDFYYSTKNANAHNFADVNTLTTFAQNIWTLASILEFEGVVAIDWLETNKMIIRPGKFQFIIIDKKKQNHTKETFKTDDKVIEVSLSVNLLGVQIVNKLNFNLHVTNTVCSYHGTYAFQSESTLYSCLRVERILPRNR